MRASRGRSLLIAFGVAVGLTQIVPAAVAEMAPEATNPRMEIELTENGLQPANELPDLRYLDWAPGSATNILLHVENQAGSPAALRLDVVDVRQRAGMADALRLTAGPQTWSVPQAQEVEPPLFTVPPGASKWTTVSLELPTETSNSVQGGSASFTIRLIAAWNGGAHEVDLAVGSGERGADSLALAGRNILAWLSIVASVLVSFLVLRHRLRVLATRSGRVRLSSHRR